MTHSLPLGVFRGCPEACTRSFDDVTQRFIYQYGGVVFLYDTGNMTIVSGPTPASVESAVLAVLGHTRPSVLVVVMATRHGSFIPRKGGGRNSKFKHYHVARHDGRRRAAADWVFPLVLKNAKEETSWTMLVVSRRVQEDPPFYRGPSWRPLFDGRVQVCLSNVESMRNKTARWTDCSIYTDDVDLVFEFGSPSWFFRDDEDMGDDVFVTVASPVVNNQATLLSGVRINKAAYAAPHATYPYQAVTSSRILGEERRHLRLIQLGTITVALRPEEAAMARRYPDEYKRWREIYDLHVAATERAASAIQRQWKRCVADPSFAVCRRRLLHEFASMVGRVKEEHGNANFNLAAMRG